MNIHLASRTLTKFNRQNILRFSSFINKISATPVCYKKISILGSQHSLFPKMLFNFTTEKSKTSEYSNIQKGEFTGPGFYVQQMLTGCLAIYSYYIESGNQAFLIDPMNETSTYEQILKARGKKLKGVFLTHYHADYIAGHLDLHKKYGAQIYLGPKAISSFGIKVLKDGEQISLGNSKLKVIHTPGHTEQSSCLLLIDQNGKQQCIFTGDTLFLNQVGRPDLAVKTNLTAEQLAGMLYESLQKVKQLDDNIRVYPGHGAGSSCGKSIGKGDFCDLKTQKQNNYGLKAAKKEQFVEQVLKQMPKPPKYFGYNAKVNKYQPFDYQEAHQHAMKKIQGKDLKKVVSENSAIIIDVRARQDLKKGLIKNAITIDFDGAFANWVGTLLKPEGAYVIYGPEERAKESVNRLLRIGYTNIKGFCCEDIQNLKNNVQVFLPGSDFVSTIYVENRKILDVRKPSEWQKGIAQGDVTKLQLSKLIEDHKKVLDKNAKYVIHCQGGYRSRIAYSILKSQGYDVKTYYDGGYGNFQKIGVKTVKPQ